MTDSPIACSDDQLEVLLNCDDTSPDFRTAAEHLDTCSRCQQRLVELAGSKADWDKAKKSLSPREIDFAFERERADRTWTSHDSPRIDQRWTESMVKQLLDPPGHPEMLGRMGRFEVERIIGAGGMGVVFKAFDSELNRPVAIKVLAPHLSGSGAARARFAREAKAAAAIVHEHVVAIHNVESEHEPPFLVMQFVTGESLQARIDREGPLKLREVLRIARQTAAALAAAHQQGLVHRDVKPSNILLEEGVDRALLTDFGLARASDDASLTFTGHALGTPHYMSPEQAKGEATRTAGDLFSLGSVMYTMCAGRPPFRAETSYGILRRITDSEPRSLLELNPDIPAWLAAIIGKLHAKSPQDRFESAEEIVEILNRCLAYVQQPQTHALPDSVQELTKKQARRNRNWKPVIAVASGCLLLMALGLFAWIGGGNLFSNSTSAGGGQDAQKELGKDSEGMEAFAWEADDQDWANTLQGMDERTLEMEQLWDDLPDSSAPTRR